MAISKVVYGGHTLVDLTSDTVKPEVLSKGYTAHGADGEPVVGTMEAGAGGGGAVSGGTGVTKTVAGAILIPVLAAGVTVTIPTSVVATSATGELNS